MSTAKAEVKSRTVSVPRRATRPSPSQGRHSAETSPLRAYISPLKDFSAYTPVRQSRERSATLRSRLNTSTEAKKKAASQTAALESMNDLKNKTSKLDEESKKLVEKVGQVRLKMQVRRGKGKKDEGKSLVKVLIEVIGKAYKQIASEALEGIRDKAEETRAVERKGIRHCYLRRLAGHFEGWKAAFQAVTHDTAHLTDIADKHFRRHLLRQYIRSWKSIYIRKDSLTPASRRIPKAFVEVEHPRPASLSPKPIQPETRPLSTSNTRKTPLKSPAGSTKSNLSSSLLTVPASFLHKKPIPSKENLIKVFEPVNQELFSLATQHHKQSLLVSPMQYYQIWKPLLANLGAANEQAKQHYRKHLGQRVFHAWLEFYVTSYESHGEASSQESDSRYDFAVRSFRLVSAIQSTVGPGVLVAWKDFVARSKAEKQQEDKRNQLWEKVNSWLEQYKSGNTQL